MFSCLVVFFQFPQSFNQICKDCYTKNVRNRLNTGSSYTTQSSGLGRYRSKPTKAEKKCANCGTAQTTLWRKFKSKEEIKIKHKNKEAQVIDAERDLQGKTGCNACCLYWSLHAVCTNGRSGITHNSGTV